MLTQSQQKVYDCVKRHSEEGLPPTVREICEETGLRSTSSVHAHLKTLEKLGLISRDAGLNRAIHITGQERSNAIQVPVLGRVAAGQPILAQEEIEGYIPYTPARPGSGDRFFGLTVHGESMRDAGIRDGDILVVRQCPAAEEGEIVVAMIEGEATVKRFFREKDRVRLQPENPDFQPIYARDVQIEGKVVALYRYY